MFLFFFILCSVRVSVLVIVLSDSPWGKIGDLSEFERKARLARATVRKFATLLGVSRATVS
jgi:hypothetical protein